MSTQARYRPRRIGHVNLFIASMPQTVEFLTQVCGFETTGLMSKIGSGFLSNGNTHHDIGFIEVDGYARFKAKRTYPIEEPADRGSSPGLNHFGWEMAHERALVEAYHRARGSGLAPRVTDNGTSYSNYLFDPDGTQHQFYADNVREWRSVYTGGEVDLHRPPKWHPDTATPSTEPMYDPSPEIRRVERAPLHPMRVTHAVLASSRLPELAAFYQDVAGLDRVATRAGGRAIYLAGQASAFDIVLLDHDFATPGLHHASFEVWPNDDLAAAERALRLLGVPVLASVDLPHKRSVVIAHPDGIRFEFFQRRGHERFARDIDFLAHGAIAA